MCYCDCGHKAQSDQAALAVVCYSLTHWLHAARHARFERSILVLGCPPPRSHAQQLSQQHEEEWARMSNLLRHLAACPRNLPDARPLSSKANAPLWLRLLYIG